MALRKKYITLLFITSLIKKQLNQTKPNKLTDYLPSLSGILAIEPIIIAYKMYSENSIISISPSNSIIKITPSINIPLCGHVHLIDRAYRVDFLNSIASKIESKKSITWKPYLEKIRYMQRFKQNGSSIFLFHENHKKEILALQSELEKNYLEAYKTREKLNKYKSKGDQSDQEKINLELLEESVNLFINEIHSMYHFLSRVVYVSEDMLAKEISIEKTKNIILHQELPSLRNLILEDLEDTLKYKLKDITSPFTGFVKPSRKKTEYLDKLKIDIKKTNNHQR
jgi:hypothetical protein